MIETNRLVKRMGQVVGGGGKAFVAYIMAGEPSWKTTLRIMADLETAGVTAIELGVPFSDPIADGPVIQAAGNRALAAGVTLRSILESVAEFRKTSDLPVLLMGYWNVFLQYSGGSRGGLLEECRASGIDGFIIPDLPLEGAGGFYGDAQKAGLCTVMLATELTPDDRLEAIARASTGFVYYVPKLGITGLDLEVTRAIRSRIEHIKTLTDQPVCVGIGVKTRDDVDRLTEVADGVIVGTRIVDFIDQNRGDADVGSKVAAMVADLVPAQH